MNWLDLVIIYLACGAPFAVYRIALSEYSPAETASRSVRAGLLWPAVGAKTVIKRLRAATRALSRPRIETIRLEMEAALTADQPAFPRFEFREVFDRYAGLAGAVRSRSDPSVAKVSHIDRRDTSPATEACMRRIVQAKVGRHAAAARRELLQYIAECGSQRVLDVAGALAAELADDSLIIELSRSRSIEDLPPVSTIRLTGSAS